MNTNPPTFLVSVDARSSKVLLKKTFRTRKSPRMIHDTKTTIAMRRVVLWDSLATLTLLGDLLF